jgi:hypothetical protein
MKSATLLTSSLAVFSILACADSSTAPSRAFDPDASFVATTAARTGPGGVRAGLRVWLRADDGIEAADGANVLRWTDLSGGGNHAVWNPLNTFQELAPVYRTANADLGGRPTVRFNEQNALELDLSWLAGSDYTILVVNGRDRGGFANLYLAGSAVAIDQNLVLGYEQTSLLRQAHFGNDLDAVVEDYVGTPVWSLDTYRFSNDAGRDLYHNGVAVATDNMRSALSANPGTTLGHFRAIPGFFFRGDLAEVVVYNRALKGAERIRVENAIAARNGLTLARP